MDDTCALHLSYLIEHHYKPYDLLPYVPLAKAGLPAQQLDAYDHVSGCHGIIYRPNKSIGSAGNKVLELAELARRGALEESIIQASSQELETSSSPGSTCRRGSDVRLIQSPLTLVNRRRSTVSTDTAEQTDHFTSRASELHRARSRIQGDVLRDVGPRSNDLWKLSLMMLSTARTLLLEPRNSLNVADMGRTRGVEQMPLLCPSSYAMKTAFSRLPPATPLALGNPNQSIVLKLPHRRKDSLAHPALTTKSATSRTETDLAELPATFKTVKIDNGYRSPLLGGLDEMVWGRIISLACGGTGILNSEQVLAVVRWARDRTSLQREMEALGKAGSAQVWRILEGMGCLAYKISV